MFLCVFCVLVLVIVCLSVWGWSLLLSFCTRRSCLGFLVIRCVGLHVRNCAIVNHYAIFVTRNVFEFGWAVEGKFVCLCAQQCVGVFVSY